MLQVVAAPLLFPQQVDQGLEHVIQTDDPVRQRGTADAPAVALEDALEPVQRQGIGVLGHQDPGQQRHTGQTFSEGVNRPGGGHHLLAAVFGVEHGLLLPVFDDPGLGRDDVQLFLDLAEEGPGSPGLLGFVQAEMDLEARQVLIEAVGLAPLARLFRFRPGGRFGFGQLLFDFLERDLQFGLVEQLALEGLFLAAGSELAQAGQAQLFFQQAEKLLLLGEEGFAFLEPCLTLLKEGLVFVAADRPEGVTLEWWGSGQCPAPFS